MNQTTPPLITVVMATFNSSKIMGKVLDSIRRQNYPQDRIEILVVDGGSSDNTREVATSYGCRVIDNPRTEPVYAKFLGLQSARGDYLTYLDHDEVLQNPRSFEQKVEVFTRHAQVKAVAGSGYVNPPSFSKVNDYINEFGDPFSYFIYGLSKANGFFIPSMRRRYTLAFDDNACAVFDFRSARDMPIIELCAAGCMIDLAYFRKEFAEALASPANIPHFFYLMLPKSPFLAITKEDALMHYSSDTLDRFLNKIRWRIKNNIYFAEMGESGFTGRDRFQRGWGRYKKFLFLPYAFSLVFPLIDSVILAVTRRNPMFLMHWALTLFTACQITYHMTRKALGLRPQMKSYDESKVITR